jgi:hypothetical protein
MRRRVRSQSSRPINTDVSNYGHHNRLSSMRFYEIAQKVRRDEYRESHPVLFRICVAGAKWLQFVRQLRDFEPAKLISYHGGSGERVAVIACWNEDVGRRLEDKWMARSIYCGGARLLWSKTINCIKCCSVPSFGLNE